MFSYLENKELDGKHINTAFLENSAKWEITDQMETCIDIVLHGDKVTDKNKNNTGNSDTSEKESETKDNKLNTTYAEKSPDDSNNSKKENTDKSETKTSSSDSTEGDDYFLFWH